IRSLAKIYKIDVKIIKNESLSNWHIHLNFLYKLGVERARNDICFLTQADIALDQRIKDYIHYAQKSIVFFRHIPYFGWNTFVAMFLSNMPFIARSSGLVAFNKNFFKKYNLIEDVDLLFDTQIAVKVKAYKIPCMYIKTISWNLRYPGDRRRLYDVGAARKKLQRSFIETLLLCMLRLQPEVLVGYLRSK
nr:hypothetical protein [Candidatus Baldrarchaeota archaeon]